MWFLDDPRVVVWRTGEAPSEVALHYEVRFATGRRDRGRIALSESLPLECETFEVFANRSWRTGDGGLTPLPEGRAVELGLDEGSDDDLASRPAAPLPPQRPMPDDRPRVFVAEVVPAPRSDDDASAEGEEVAEHCDVAIYAHLRDHSDIQLGFVARGTADRQALGLGPTAGDQVVLVALLPLYAAAAAAAFAVGGTLYVLLVGWFCIFTLGQQCPADMK